MLHAGQALFQTADKKRPGDEATRNVLNFSHSTALPEFVNANISITAIVQSEVTLPCDIIPDPTVTYTWQFGGVLVNPSTSGGTYTILSDGSLVIANVQETLEGMYSCVVTNPLGAASGNVLLTVHSEYTFLRTYTFFINYFCWLLAIIL